MAIENKKTLILGGTGLIGEEIVNRLSQLGSQITIVSLGSNTDQETFSNLQKKTPSLKHITGNIFLPTYYKDQDFGELLKSQEFLNSYLELIYRQSNYKAFFLNKILEEVKPDIIIDAVNSATALSYTKNLDLIQSYLKGGRIDTDMVLGSLSIPRLISFFYCLYNSLLEVPNCTLYLKIGTTGTGGMGFNIPFTHGENKPSYQLMEKAAVSGAFTGLLYVLGQTFGLPSIKEVKPAALVGYKKIEYGKIYANKNKNEVLRVYNFQDIKKIELKSIKDLHFNKATEKPDKSFEAVFVDTGENGQFALEEFRTISNKRQMGFITKEEIAEVVINEIAGKKTGKEVIYSMEQTVLGPSQAGQQVRETIIANLESLAKQKERPSLAFEILGPPRLAKLIFEAYLIGQKTQFEVNKLSEDLFQEENISNEDKSLIVSTGIPILLTGNILLIGKEPKPFSSDNIEKLAENGWVDLRPSNLEKWQMRLQEFKKTNQTLEIGDIVAWIFEVEDKGFKKLD